ncbi:hypothetical protein BN874_1490002 [Candidatus Contendobacter odensis Run_B_J11]|uniref:Uncharacterized protein n=1 Tax=Candidatus Contendobacter odensis Run_B_J11 TaxID=1400861 RepID=A0A7U7G9Q7_9GAMM|nr:hypothetical protein BN874_1490002 [Candidatus Contendobacter odensis Run_B_J11]
MCDRRQSYGRMEIAPNNNGTVAGAVGLYNFLTAAEMPLPSQVVLRRRIAPNARRPKPSRPRLAGSGTLMSVGGVVPPSR